MKVFFYLPMSLLLLILLQGCHPFSNKNLNTNYIQLSSENKVLVENSYEISPFRILDDKGPLSEKHSMDLYSNIIEILKDEGQVLEQLPSGKRGEMNLKFVNGNTLSISISENFEELHYEEVKGHFKKDGFFYLDQTFSSSLGIPYIIGGRYKYQTRLGLSMHGALIVQSKEVNQGALLFLIWKGYVRRKEYQFRKMQLDLKA